MRPLLIFLITMLCWPTYAQDETVLDLKDGKAGTDIFITVDEPPQFKGGEKALGKFYKKNSTYQITKDRTKGATVYFQMVINKDGTISDPKIIRSPSRDLENEVKNLVGLMPKWVPGKKEGVPVKVRVTKEIIFVTK